MQPRTRGPEAVETKTMTVAWPHHACVPLSKRRQRRPARSTQALLPKSLVRYASVRALKARNQRGDRRRAKENWDGDSTVSCLRR
eukprot:scaffold57145_cov36-Phaeocystis_antarctica.AAC.1